jgi:hypothetical protein
VFENGSNKKERAIVTTRKENVKNKMVDGDTTSVKFLQVFITKQPEANG